MDASAVWRDKLRYGGNREAVIKRDGYKCVACGMTRREHVRRFNMDITVDHKDGKGIRSPRAEKNNSMDNLQTLCMPCHQKKDHKHKKLTDTQVVNIRHMKGELTQRAIGELYGVTSQYVGQLHRGLWRETKFIRSVM